MHGHRWGMSWGKGHSLPFAGNAHTNPCMHISILLFSKPLPGLRLFFYPAPCPHIRVTPNGGTYLPLAPSELEGQWDKALGTGQRWSFPCPKMRRAAPLPLPLPAPTACTVASGITHGSWHHPWPLSAWPRCVSGARHGTSSEGPLDEDHRGDKEMPKALAWGVA